MRFKPCLGLIIIGLLVIACQNESGDKDGEDETSSTPISLIVLPSQTYQTIQNFGASDAWSTQFVGKFWPDEAKNQMAKWLFSTENDSDGNPMGIGLSCWRFNIGGGSAEQGNDSQIGDEWRRAETFLNEDGSYDWTRQEGQQWFLKTAKANGINQFIGFVNSPPVSLTKNGKAWSDNGSSANLDASNYPAYSDFLVNVVGNVETQTGVSFNYISPFNEPQWDWKCCGQEGSPWNNSELFEMTEKLDSAFQKNNISAKIELTEAGQIDYLYSSFNLPNRGNQIENFFDPNGIFYVGDLPSVAYKVAGHSYYSTWNTDWLIESRTMLHQKMKEVSTDLPYWMTEYTILENNDEIEGNGRDLGMNAALYMARVIHADLTVANAEAWQWWLAISPYDYKDGLIYTDYSKFGGNYTDSKMLWALGHYSRFIRPGYQRIQVRRSDNRTDINGLLFSAYSSENFDELVVVLTNQTTREQSIEWGDLSDSYKTVEVYLTNGSEDNNLTLQGVFELDSIIMLPRKSMVTCVIKD